MGHYIDTKQDINTTLRNGGTATVDDNSTYLAIRRTSGTSIAAFATSGTGSHLVTFKDSTGTTQIYFPSNNFSYFKRAEGLVIGSDTAVSSSICTCTSTSRGFLPPRMTTAQKNAIASPADGLLVFDTDLNKLSLFRSAAWTDFP
jgi:hypothetical protein